MSGAMRLRSLVPSLALLACSREPSPATSSSAAPPASPVAPATAPAKGILAVGAPAPPIVATAHDGTSLDLAALRGKPVVLYFYPKDETPGCTKEACAFRDAWDELAKTGVVLIGISSDTLDSHRKFAEHHKLPFHLVSDESGAIAKAYGVPSTAGFLARQTFVIDKEGRIAKEYRSVDVSKHAAEVLADLKGGGS